MFFVRLAALTIAVSHQYEYLKDICTDYIVSEGKADFSVSATPEEIAAEGAGVEGFESGYLESLAIYRKMAEVLPDYDGFLMHGVLTEVDNCGIAFLAKSGVGKTTHVGLWKNLLADKLTVINGDKPLVRLDNGTFKAYGTPWAGKENLHINRETVLKKICFIERAEENSCQKLTPHEGLLRLLPQIYRSGDAAHRLKTLDLATKLSEQVSFYVMACNTDPSAAEVAYKGMML